jgi:hypothetical protein
MPRGGRSARIPARERKFLIPRGDCGGCSGGLLPPSRLAELYNKWFLRRLPTGETLNLPMSPQLEEVFRMLGQSE